MERTWKPRRDTISKKKEKKTAKPHNQSEAGKAEHRAKAGLIKLGHGTAEERRTQLRGRFTAQTTQQDKKRRLR
jgi:hypothetical protein